MPQEFLRDVLRAGDSAQRRQRHWSVLPLSITGHAVVLTVFLFSPWLRRGGSSGDCFAAAGFHPDRCAAAAGSRSPGSHSSRHQQGTARGAFRDYA